MITLMAHAWDEIDAYEQFLDEQQQAREAQKAAADPFA
jgi:hypothetical protein